MTIENDFTRVFGAIKELEERVAALELGETVEEDGTEEWSPWEPDYKALYESDRHEVARLYGRVADLIDAKNQLRFVLSILAAVKEGGWEEWRGGECPTDDFEEVDFMTRDGTLYEREPAETVLWEHENKHYDTVAWRFAR
jgi:hypothetical protein